MFCGILELIYRGAAVPNEDAMRKNIFWSERLNNEQKLATRLFQLL